MITKSKVIIAIVSTITLTTAALGTYSLYQQRTVSQKVPQAKQAGPSPSPTGFSQPPLPLSLQTTNTNIQPETGIVEDPSAKIEITIQNPLPDSQVYSPLEIRGLANTPQGFVSIILKDSQGSILGQSEATACFAKDPCPFSLDLTFSTSSTQTGTLEVFSPSKTGEQEYLKSINLNF